MKILVIRNDGIGDLILTLPAISFIRKVYKDSYIAILIKEEIKDILWNNSEIDEIIFDENKILEKIYKRFDIAFVFYPNWRNSILTFLARIPIRVGTGFKACGLLFNKRVYIHRRNCHEAEWCLRIAGSNLPPEPPKIFVKASNLEYVKKLISYNKESRLIGIHPCGKTSLSLSEESYAKLIEKIEEKYKTRVIITGSLNDKPIIERIISKTKADPLNLCGMTNLGELIALISLYKTFIGPATGPMHIAACLGIRTIAIFPPNRSLSSKKWHPLGENYITLTPDIICKEKICKKEKCKENCMDRISLDMILEKIG